MAKAESASEKGPTQGERLAKLETAFTELLRECRDTLPPRAAMSISAIATRHGYKLDANN